MVDKDHSIRCNRPGWRKIRGYGYKLVRDKNGRPIIDARGRQKFNRIKIKTKKWEKV